MQGSDLVERLREAARDEAESAVEQDFWHEEILTEAADEIERLYSLAKANNELARRNRQEADAMRSQSITNARERNAAIDEIERLRALTNDASVERLVEEIRLILYRADRTNKYQERDRDNRDYTPASTERLLDDLLAALTTAPTAPVVPDDSHAFREDNGDKDGQPPVEAPTDTADRREAIARIIRENWDESAVETAERSADAILSLIAGLLPEGKN